MSHPNPLPNKNWPPPALNWVSLPPWQTTMFSHLTCCACSWAHWQRRKLLSCLTIFFTGTKSHYTLSYKEAVMSLMCSHTCMDFVSKGEIVGVLRCCSGSILQVPIVGGQHRQSRNSATEGVERLKILNRNNKKMHRYKSFFFFSFSFCVNPNYL